MLKTFTFVLCATLGFVMYVQSANYDKCRSKVPLPPVATCGPEQTMYNEGECLCCYKDTMNIPTIGIGFNLRRKDAEQVLANYNLNLSNALKGCNHKTTKYCLTDAAAKEIFNNISYPAASSCVDKLAPGLPPVIRAAIIDVAFIGCNKLSKFKKMLIALNNQDWQTAANELNKSNWCKQVGQRRCKSDVKCITSYSSCTSQICPDFTPNCSINSECYCWKTSNNGPGFCGLTFPCDTYPVCTIDCSPLTSVCVEDTCCGSSQCIPLSLGDACLDPPTRARSKSKNITLTN